MKIILILILFASCTQKNSSKLDKYGVDFSVYDSFEIIEYQYETDSFPGIHKILNSPEAIKMYNKNIPFSNFKIKSTYFLTEKSFSACFVPHHSIIMHKGSNSDTIDICVQCRNYSFNNGPTKKINQLGDLIDSLNEFGANIENYEK